MSGDCRTVILDSEHSTGIEEDVDLETPANTDRLGARLISIQERLVFCAPTTIPVINLAIMDEVEGVPQQVRWWIDRPSHPLKTRVAGRISFGWTVYHMRLFEGR